MKIHEKVHEWGRILIIVIVLGGCAYMFVTGMAEALSRDSPHKPSSIEYRILVLQEQLLIKQLAEKEVEK
jgi:hypothetical protein